MPVHLSPKHGLNSSVALCLWCGEETGLVLFGQMKGDAEAPRQCVPDREPCSTCQQRRKTHVLFIAVDEAKSPDKDNPHRTGLLCWLPEHVINEQIQPPELRDHILLCRVCFIPHEIWEQIGLPTEGGAFQAQANGSLEKVGDEFPDDPAKGLPSG